MKIKRNKKSGFARQLAMGANKEELHKFELIKDYHQRKSDSDMIRFLINQEAEKILKKSTPIVVNQK